MSEYFTFLIEFSRSGIEQCLMLLKSGAIQKCSQFYLNNRRPQQQQQQLPKSATNNQKKLNLKKTKKVNSFTSDAESICSLSSPKVQKSNT